MNKTLARVGYAPITEMTSEKTVYEQIKYFESEKSGGREYRMSPQGENKTIYADGKPVIDVVDHAGYEGSVTLIDVLDDIEQDWYGNKKTTTGGTVDGAGITKQPHFALIIVQETLNGDKKYQVDTYYNCTATSHERSGKTSEGEGFDPDFPEIPLVARDRLDGKGSHGVEYVDELPTEVIEPSVVETVVAKAPVAVATSESSKK